MALDASDWMKNPELEVIETDKEDRVNAFTLHLSQSAPDEDNGEGQEGASGGAS